MWRAAELKESSLGSTRLYLYNKSIPFGFTLDGLDGHVFAFPFGFAHDSESSSAHHLKE